MKCKYLMFLGSVLCFTYGFAQNASKPFVKENLIFEDKNGMAVVEAEHFYKQTKTDVRAWYINSPVHQPLVWPDHDTATYVGAGGNAYVEALPDLFHSEEDPIISGDNLGSGGNVAVMHYNVYFNKAGRYYLWTRLRSNDQEDNTIGAGIDGTYPKTAQILQSPVEKKMWIWKSDNRLSRTPWKIGRACLDVTTVGLHDVQFYMREDGEEFDRFILTTDSLYSIVDGIGPEVTVKEGDCPKAFDVNAKMAPIVKGIANPDGAIYGANVMYKDTLGMVSFEAENFYRQTLTQNRMWHLVTPTFQSKVGPDNDTVHVNGASGGAYLELLPDGRQKDEDGINSKNSICGVGGQAAVVSYFVDFQKPGTYYFWVRALAVDGDDNTLHVGIDNTWPDTSKKLTFQGRQWSWSNTQRDTKAKISFTIEKAGVHQVHVSMREDGCEIDRIFICNDENFKPNDSIALPGLIKQGNLQKWIDNREKLMDNSLKYVGSNGAIVFEAESAPTHGGWLYMADTLKHAGLGYIEWGAEGQGIKEGKGTLTYTFEISEAGNYQVLLRSKMKDATNRMDTPDADGNDVWLKLNGGMDVQKQVALGDKYNKIAILGHPNGWTWNSNADKGKPHPLAPICRYYEKGVYTLEISGRSKGHAIDRIALVKFAKKPTTDYDGDIATKLNGMVQNAVPLK